MHGSGPFAWTRSPGQRGAIDIYARRRASLANQFSESACIRRRCDEASVNKTASTKPRRQLQRLRKSGVGHQLHGLRTLCRPQRQTISDNWRNRPAELNLSVSTCNRHEQGILVARPLDPRMDRTAEDHRDDGVPLARRDLVPKQRRIAAIIRTPTGVESGGELVLYQLV